MAAEVKQLVRNPELQVQATRKGAIKEMLQIQPSSSVDPHLNTAPTLADSTSPVSLSPP